MSRPYFPSALPCSRFRPVSVRWTSFTRLPQLPFIRVRRIPLFSSCRISSAVFASGIPVACTSYPSPASRAWASAMAAVVFCPRIPSAVPISYPSLISRA